MAWRKQVNVRLARRTGIQLRQRDGRIRLVRNPQRELSQPAFILSSVRSGSTLLRLMLNSHSQIFAPHELHLAHIKVELGIPAAENAVTALDLSKEELTHMLWDRLLNEALRRSGKSVLVEKTPNLVFMWHRVASCWPDARFIFLLRHPGAVLDSWQRARPRQTRDEAVRSVRRYLAALREARSVLPGHTVRYEELTADPERITQGLCAFLGMEWEPGMVEYGSHRHGDLRSGLGDWTEKIRTGVVQPARPVPTMELPAGLRTLAADLGY